MVSSASVTQTCANKEGQDRKIRQQIQPRKCLLLCETYGPKCKKDDLQTGTNDPTTLSEDLEVPSAKGAIGVL